MYGFLCNPFSVTSQIKASKVQVQSTISDGDKSALDDADVSLMDSSLPTQSRPKPKFSLFRKASIQTLTDELCSFVMDIRWNHEAYQQFERKLLDSRGSFLTYTFDFSPLSPKSKLVKLLRQEFELNSNLWFSVEDIDNSVLSMTVLLENYFECPPNFDQSSPYNQNCFTSLEYTFICSVRWGRVLNFAEICVLNDSCYRISCLPAYGASIRWFLQQLLHHTSHIYLMCENFSQRCFSCIHWWAKKNDWHVA